MLMKKIDTKESKCKRHKRIDTKESKCKQFHGHIKKKKSLSCEGNPALGFSSREGVESPFLNVINWKWPRAFMGIVDPALSSGIGLDALQRPFPISVFL